MTPCKYGSSRDLSWDLPVLTWPPWNMNQFWNINGTSWRGNRWNLFNFVSNLRKPGENLFPDMVPIEFKGVCPGGPRGPKWPQETPEGYAQFWNGILKKYFTMHRYLMNFPEDLVVDHLTWNRLDNRKAHLKPCSQAENARNGAAGWNFGKKTTPILKLNSVMTG